MGPAAMGLVAAVLITLGVPALRAAAQDAGPGTSEREPAVHGHADYDWALRGLDGEPFRLERYSGRTLVLNVWATWCAPCVRELASLERLAASVADTDIAFLLVSPERGESVRAFLDRHGYGLPAAVEDQRMPASFGLEAVPTTWVIDPDGRIVLKHRGAARWDTDEVRALLRHLAR